MGKVDVKKVGGGKAGSVELDDALFGITPNVAVLHQVVTAQLAARRSGTQSTKTRAEVSGGGAKPWRQKGTGRARQGSIRSPQWVGGGVTHAPKPRSYAQRTPKKMIRLALRSALSDRAAEGKVTVIDGWDIEAPSTKAAVKALDGLGLTGKLLVVLAEEDEAVWKSFRNLGHVHCILTRELNAYDILASDHVVFTKETLPTSAPAKDATPSGETDVMISASNPAGDESSASDPAADESAASDEETSE